MEKKFNIIETYNWLNEAFVHQTEEITEQDSLNRIIYYKTADHEPISDWYHYYNFESRKSDIPELIASNTYDKKTDTGILIFKEPVTNIGDYAFAYCATLTFITIPEGVKSIGDAAFASCETLESITIPESVTSIGECAFAGCHSLTSVTIPEGVKSIGIGAFEVCRSLTTITIPKSVTSIGKEAFFLCQSLKKVFYKGNEFRDESSIITALENSNVSLGTDII